MSREIVWTERALKDVERLDLRTRERVVGALERLASTDQGDIKRLQGSGDQWRLRVGDWRVRFRYDSDTGALDVLRVLPRGRAYRD